MLPLLQQQQGEQLQQPGERRQQLELQHEEQQQHQQQLKGLMSIQQDLLLLDSMKESFNFY